MKATVSRWGNSLGLRLPKRLIDELEIREGTQVDLEPAQNGGYTLRVASISVPIAKFSLSSLVADLEPMSQEEVDWGQPQGDEVW